jgi:hypothetical protein
MARVSVILAIVELALMIFAFVDVLLTQNERIRGVPKIVWVLVVLLLPFVGPILWFVLGKERSDSDGQPRTVAPDDDPDFLARLREKEDQDERIRRLEQELADLDDDQPDGK